MKFSEQLRKENDDVYEAIFNHPFVAGIGIGDLPKNSLIHYIKADHGYLTVFAEIYGIAISKSRTREEIEYFKKQIEFVLYGEADPHECFCKAIGINYEGLQGYPLPPTADHFVKHMLYHAHTGGLGELIAALLPCPLTYFAIGKKLMQRYKPTPNHPFYDWIVFYADPNIEELKMVHILDEIAEGASEAELENMRDAYRKSCQLELGFWEMAYTCEEWEPKDVVLND